MFGFRTPPKKKKSKESEHHSDPEDKTSKSPESQIRTRSTSESRKKLNTYGTENVTKKTHYQKSKTKGIVKDPSKKPTEPEETAGAQSLGLQTKTKTTKLNRDNLTLPIDKSISFPIPLQLSSELNTTFIQDKPNPLTEKPTTDNSEQNQTFLDQQNKDQNKIPINPTTQTQHSNIHGLNTATPQELPTTQTLSSTTLTQNIASIPQTQNTIPIISNQNQNPSTLNQTQAPTLQGFPNISNLFSKNTTDQGSTQNTASNLDFDKISANIA